MDLYQKSVDLLKQRGVKIEDIAEIVIFSQKKYFPDLKLEDAIESIERVLRKREVQNAIITGVELDILAERKMLSEPLQKMMDTDDWLYGIDEVLVFSIVNVYGSIGFTNFGYLDKLKPLILEKLNDKNSGVCNVFLDDIVAAIAAAASSRMAHNVGGVYEENPFIR